MNTPLLVPTCACGSVDFRPVEIDRGPHRPLYRTEFEACTSCGAMYHRHARRTLFKPMGPMPAQRVEQPQFRPEVDTTGWKPPPDAVWIDEP